MASIVDYLKSKGQDSSYNARKQLAQQYGIENYSGTANQNVSLLSALQKDEASKAQTGQAQQPSENVTAGTGAQEQTQQSPTTNTSSVFKYSGSANLPSYTRSPQVNEYYNRVQDYENNMPDEYESKYTDMIDDILDSIMNRPKFEYGTEELNADPLYQMYADSYKRNAQLAMRDTMANATALSGGYGTSYAQSVGQQAYDATMAGLNDRALDFYDRAYGRYQDELQDLYNQMGVVTGLDATDYSRYRDEVSDYFTNRDYYNNRYNQEYGYDYGQYQDKLALQQWAEEYAWQQAQADQAQANWQAEMDFQREQFEWQKQQAAEAAARAAAKSRSSSKKKDKEDTRTGFLPWTARINNDLATGNLTQLQAYEEIMEQGEKGNITQQEALQAMREAGIDADAVEAEARVKDSILGGNRASRLWTL
ncbi:MAG TPA: hypothetical protein IAB34_06810 [Candidatus Egerieimonas faecigallinarum]|nr:hypothetical protein [Candidatus Egerieimonas faecigallinarum]